jgi:hypothetical protein
MSNPKEAGVVAEKKLHRSVGFKLLLSGAVLMGAGLASPVMILIKGMAEFAGIVVLAAGAYRLWKGFIVTERDVLRLCDEQETDSMHISSEEIIREFGCTRKDAEALVKSIRAGAYKDMSNEELIGSKASESEGLDRLIDQHKDVVGDVAKGDEPGRE